MTGRRRATGIALLALLGAVVLLAAGCGGSDSEPAAAEETTQETDTTTTDAGTSTDVDLGNFANEDCLELASIGAKFSEAVAGTGSGTDFEQTSALFGELAANAPEEIKDDLTTLAGAWQEIAEALAGVDMTSGTPSAEDVQKLQEVGQKLSTPELQQASANLTTWAQENCSGTG